MLEGKKSVPVRRRIRADAPVESEITVKYAVEPAAARAISGGTLVCFRPPIQQTVVVPIARIQVDDVCK
jgi:hypothetical protein